MPIALTTLFPATNLVDSFQLQAELCELTVNFSIRQNHLEVLLKHKIVGPTPRVTDFIGLNLMFQQDFQVILTDAEVDSEFT